MPYDVRRFAMFVGGLMCLVLPASAAEAQTRPHRFEIAAESMTDTSTSYAVSNARSMATEMRFQLRASASN